MQVFLLAVHVKDEVAKPSEFDEVASDIRVLVPNRPKMIQFLKLLQFLLTYARSVINIQGIIQVSILIFSEAVLALAVL